MGEEYEFKHKKKVVKIRRLSNHDNDIPGTSRDPNRNSQSSLSTLSRIDSVFSLVWGNNNTTDREEEIQVIDLDNISYSSSHPIEFLFPDIKQEGVNVNSLMRITSATDITKLLIGQKAQFTNLRSTIQRRKAVDFSPIVEVNDENEDNDEEFSSSDENLKKTPSKKHTYDPIENSTDADISYLSDTEK